MTDPLVEKLEDVRDFKKILETTVKELGETYQADVCQIVLSNPLDQNITSICEYLANPEQIPDMTSGTSFPVPLQGGAIGMVSLARQHELQEHEVKQIRLTLADIADIIRYAQINDIVQRDTFRTAFMAEIVNVMNYSLGIGDALFMVVNILGKVLNTSRCLFVCTDDEQSGWKAYEYWQRERVSSCSDYGWPSTGSPVIAQALLSKVPFSVYEGQDNSYMTPVQEDLQILGVRSMLATAIRSSEATHGCIILQQCESRHAWTRGEIDMVQNVADTVAEALLKLPIEKKGREPIMRLHQREVSSEGENESIQSVRKSLKGALGSAAIPKAQKTSSYQKPAPTPPPTVLPEPIEPPQDMPEVSAPSVGPTTWSELADPPETFASTVEPAGLAADAAKANPFGSEVSTGSPDYGQPSMPLGGLADLLVDEAANSAEHMPAPNKSLTNLLGGILGGRKQATKAPTWDFDSTTPGGNLTGEDNESSQAQPAGSGLAEIAAVDPTLMPTSKPDSNPIEVSLPEPIPAKTSSPSSVIAKLTKKAPPLPPNIVPPPYAGVDETFEVAEELQIGDSSALNKAFGAPDETEPATFEPKAPEPAALEPAALDDIGPATSQPSRWGDLDNIPTPQPLSGADTATSKVGQTPRNGVSEHSPAAAKATSTKWGDLDSIPAPNTGSGINAPAASVSPALKVSPAASAATVSPAAPAPTAPPPPGPGSSWGNLDAIPTPAASGTSKPGLGGAMLGKARASSIGAGGLGSAFGRGAAKAAAQQSEFAEGPPIEIDEVAAEAKLKEILSTTNLSSDYIYATAGVSPRILGRIDGWVSEIEGKDKYLHGHARQVAEYCQAIARLLGLGQDEVDEIRLAALIHDVGKLGVPQNILQTPDEELDDAQLLMLMNHPVVGAELVSPFPELAHLSPIVLAHHEEFDGNGYPQGLSGEAIPLASRIIFVANSYFTMVTDLCFRQGIPIDKAQDNLRMGAGVCYDPAVVDALLACISQGLVPARID